MEKEIILNEGKKPLWQRIIASILYTILIYFIFLFFTNNPIAFTNTYVNSFVYLFEYGVIIISAAIPFSLTRNHYFDFDDKMYKLEYCIGYLKFGSWKELPQLEYISVFKKENIYEVNLWYYRNEHFNIYAYFEQDDAIEVGFSISEKLNIDLLDATSHSNFKWIDKKLYKESGVVKYIN